MTSGVGGNNKIDDIDYVEKFRWHKPWSQGRIGYNLCYRNIKYFSYRAHFVVRAELLEDERKLIVYLLSINVQY